MTRHAREPWLGLQVSRLRPQLSRVSAHRPIAERRRARAGEVKSLGMMPVSFVLTNDPELDLDELSERFAQAMGDFTKWERVASGSFKCLAATRARNPSRNLIRVDADKQLVLIFDGAIYNREQLKQDFPFAQDAEDDAELFAVLYKRLGSEMVKELNADFAAVIIDERNESIYVARDRLGARALFHSHEKGACTVASEVALALSVVSDKAIDERAVRQYRKLRTFFHGRTLYRAIREFPPAHFSVNGVLHRYWSYPQQSQEPPTDKELHALIADAVRIRAGSSTGSFLSGGLDSSIIAVLAKPSRTWSVGFRHENEFRWAELVAAQSGSAHQNIAVSEGEFRMLVRRLVDRRREPLTVPNEVLMWKACEEMVPWVDGVLSGEGADELFFGYDRIFRWAAQERWSLHEFDRHYSYGRHEDDDILHEALAPFMSFKSCVDRVAAFFQLAHLRGLLRRLDFATRQHGLAALTPFADYRLVERMANVPFDYRMKDGIVKEPLKRLFAEQLPPEIVQRRKVGFPVPLADIYADESGVSPMEQWLELNLRLAGAIEA